MAKIDFDLSVKERIASCQKSLPYKTVYNSSRPSPRSLCELETRRPDVVVLRAE